MSIDQVPVGVTAADAKQRVTASRHRRRRGGHRDAADGLIEIPWAVRWLVPRGERFANFDILNDTDTQLDYFRRFGHIYAVGVPTKKWRIVMVSDPDLLDEFDANPDQFGKRAEEINLFRQLQATRGHGVSVIGDGDEYARARAAMMPWYSPTNQRTQFPMVVSEARRMVDDWARMPDGKPVDMLRSMEQWALSVAGRGACNYDFRVQGGTEPRPLAAAVVQSTKEAIRRTAEPRPDMAWMPGSPARRRSREFHRHSRELFDAADVLVRGRMGTCPVGSQSDLLTVMISSGESGDAEPLSPELMRDQVLMHFSNGFLGPSIIGAWAVYLLASHPDVEARLIDEVDAVSGGDPSYTLRFEDLRKLRYTMQVIKETLRLYPPQPVQVRRSIRDGSIGRYRLRNNDIILIGTLAAQRDPRYWGPDPSAFDPDRFDPGRTVDRPAHAFAPFSLGPRQCMAQEVSYMMLRTVLFEVYRRYRPELVPSATVVKNTTVTIKPESVPMVPVRRHAPATRDGAEPIAARSSASALQSAPAPSPGREWDLPSEIPASSDYRHLVVAYGSNFGANKSLAERLAEHSERFGYTSEVLTLNELADRPARTGPWLLAVLTSTYTGNAPSNAARFKTSLAGADGEGAWRQCRYLVWGLGNSEWSAFLAFPRYVHDRLAELGAQPVCDFGSADVGLPDWERAHDAWLDQAWPALLTLSGARPTEAAAARESTLRAEAGRLTGADSATAMTRSLTRGSAAPRVLMVPRILTNPVGAETMTARVAAGRELQAAGSSRHTRHLELTLPEGVTYQAGDHIGICPRNGDTAVETLARRLGAIPEGLFMVPKNLAVQAVPKGVVLQVRNVLTSMVDIAGRPTVALIDLLAAKVTEPAEMARLAELRGVLADPSGPASPLRNVIDAGGYDVLEVLEEARSATVNIFEFLQVAQPLRPRYYSTSSSPRTHGDRVAHLTVGLDRAAVAGRPGRVFGGMCAGYVHRVREDDRIDVFVDGADGFHLQDDTGKPMIFVSAGTGFAPMRAFLWERLALHRAGRRLGEALLFNGIRSRSEDFIYADEIDTFVAEGVLDHVHIVASRERPGRAEHVQDRIRAQSGLVRRLLDAGGYVYVCGSKAMRAGVRAAFVDVAAAGGSMTPQQAENYLAGLETTEARYRADVWG